MPIISNNDLTKEIFCITKSNYLVNNFANSFSGI